ncbi:MAG: hypothetical protein EON56_05100 [Alphaproteobacteria bacterium]|nr:MAG: hypothetical protein EON56_05100 [Alphaproteobacteria bacterium]
MRAIYRSFWQNSHWMVASIAVVTLVSSLFGIATPFVFSRLIDELAAGNVAAAVAAGFVGYAAMRGLETLFGNAAGYMSFMVSENLKFNRGHRVFRQAFA